MKTATQWAVVLESQLQTGDDLSLELIDQIVDGLRTRLADTSFRVVSIAPIYPVEE
jgi:hypothetical protein